MKLKITKKGSKKFGKFSEQQWPHANREHFGRDIEWITKNHVLELYENDDMVGALELKIEGGVAFISTLIVALEKQGKGIGKQLVKKAEEIANKSNAYKIYLVTGKDWESVKFYEALGYEITAQHPNHYFQKDFVEFTKTF